MCVLIHPLFGRIFKSFITSNKQAHKQSVLIIQSNKPKGSKLITCYLPTQENLVVYLQQVMRHSQIHVLS